MTSSLQQRAEAAKKVTALNAVDHYRTRLLEVLPRFVDRDRFIAITISQIRQTKELAKCDPLSLVAAVIKASMIGLEPGPLQQVYLVPFGTEVQMIIGYRGIVTLARRSGEIADIAAEVVYEGDDFDYDLGTSRAIKHKRGTERGPLTHAYSFARFRDGGMTMTVLDAVDVEARRMSSQMGKANKGPWKDHTAAMWRKSAIRALEPFLPLTIEAAAAVAADEKAYQLSDIGDVIDAESEEGQNAIETGVTEPASEPEDGAA